jgi:hypothetical protein
LKSTANRLRFDCMAFLRGFGDMRGKLHGLPKKVLQFESVATRL